MTAAQEFRSPITRIVARIVRGICSRPDECEIEESYYSDDHPSLSIDVAPHAADYRVICGRKGQQIKALQAFVELSAGRAGIPCRDVCLLETFNGMGEDTHRPFLPKPDFDAAVAVELARDMWRAAVGHEPEITCSRLEPSRIALRIGCPNHEEHVVAILRSLLYPWGYAQGCVIETHKGIP